MRDREEQICRDLNEVLTGLSLEVFAGVTKKEDALELLEAMKAEIVPAIWAIEKTAAQIQNS